MARPLLSVALAAAVLAGAPAHAVDVPTRAEMAAEVAALQVQIDTIKAALPGASQAQLLALQGLIDQAWVDISAIEADLVANEARLQALESGGQ